MNKAKKTKYKRIAFYNRVANNSFWDEYWQSILIEDLLHKTIVEKLALKYLSKKSRVLEAGCGLGQHVRMLSDLGFEIEGIDFGSVTIRRAKKNSPCPSLTIGDVLLLPYRTSSFHCCLSLGVVEHFPKGPEPIIAEMNRVMEHGGLLIISVPFFNPLRRLKNSLGCFRAKRSDNRQFYQYAFSTVEFAHILEKNGFQTMLIIPDDVLSGLTIEISFLNSIAKIFERHARKNRKNEGGQSTVKLNFISFLVSHFLEKQFLSSIAGHMVFFIAKKTST